jgi:hypothetical protein
MWSAGCDQVFSLERPDAAAVDDDDDGDGVMNSADPCPHLPHESAVDADRDGISVDCDVDDAVRSTRRYFSFRAGDTEDLVRAADGIYAADGDAIMLGEIENQTSLVLEVATSTALVDVGVQMLENAIEDGAGAGYVELGVFTVHRAFTQDRSMRGDNCFVGRNNDQPRPGYLEFNEDNIQIPVSPRFPGPLSGLTGRMRHVRTPARVACRLVREGVQEIAAGFDVLPALETATGKIAITTDRVRVRVDYAWLSYQ